MSHTSPATFLVWSVIACFLFAFMIFHLWSFDRFKCLKWNNGPYSGAFKRIMTYSYLLGVPLIMTYAIGFSIIKYRQGFIDIGGTIVPMPYVFWPESDRRAIFPLLLTFTFAWSFEMVTHLEELCFWLFLVNSGSVQQEWFRSWYFRFWVFGSVVAMIYMPLLTILTRSDPLKSEAYTFLGGSLGSLSLTLWFTPILWAFPAFLKSLKSEGVDAGTIVRLTKFHELNTIRVCCRFIFVIPLLILGVDGVRPHVHINESMLWTDFLTVFASFGFCISSALTLVIFFPRSVEGEIAAKEATRDRKRQRSTAPSASFAQVTDRYSQYSISEAGGGHYTVAHQTRQSLPPPGQDPFIGSPTTTPQLAQKEWTPEMQQQAQEDLPYLPAMRPNRRRGEDVEMGGIGHTRTGPRGQQPGNLNPLVHNFTSPIDFYGGG
ncbi:hypothetical protein GGX14DRAFT_665566 [Mycena pura]|uniref:Transmembrane protein n=1 Tax=Mycena pura TaxID=153505 RepID=A0AAD6V357_9AGAR|nr:hypothetical protein GGX14DRAFT_665566 [Mycena pura]